MSEAGIVASWRWMPVVHEVLGATFHKTEASMVVLLLRAQQRRGGCVIGERAGGVKRERHPRQLLVDRPSIKILVEDAPVEIVSLLRAGVGLQGGCVLDRRPRGLGAVLGRVGVARHVISVTALALHEIGPGQVGAALDFDARLAHESGRDLRGRLVVIPNRLSPAERRSARCRSRRRGCW